MSDLSFSYSGAELAPLLERLRAHHTAEVDRLDKQLATFTEAQKQSARTVDFKLQFAYDKSGALKPKPAVEHGECSHALQAREQVWIALRETELWLMESLRTPNTRWQLTLKDLGLLYPAQTARETLVAFQAASSGRGGWFYRLAVALAGWLWPHRRPALPPASIA